MPDEQEEQRRSKRPVSFAQAYAQTKIGATHSLDKIEEWADKYNKQLEASAKAGQEEQEDKNFWGKAATWGTTLGCAAISILTTVGTTLGGCVALGAAVGIGTRYAIDKGNDWEDAIPNAIEDLDVKYYRDKIPEIAEDINDAADNLQDWNDNMWKADIMAQLGDSWTAYSMGSTGASMAKVGAFGKKAKAGVEGFKSFTTSQDPVIKKLQENIDINKELIDNIIKSPKKETE